MAATTTLLGLVTPTQGTLSGTWGDTVNYGITDYVDIAIAGTLSFAGDGAITLANTTGSASGNGLTTTTAQYMVIRVTGTLTTTKIITGPSYSKLYMVDHAGATSAVTFKAAGQTGVTIAVGEKAFVYYNGTDYVKVSSISSTGILSPVGGGTGVANNAASTLTISGAFATTLTVSGTTGITLPTTGTLSTLAGTETLSNKTLTAPALGTPASGTLSACTVDGTNKVGYLNIPLSGTKTTSYTLVVGDVGKFVILGTSGTVVVPASIFAVGDAISVANNTAAAITCTSSAVTAYLGGTNTVVTSFSLASRGVCTILYVTASVVFITGNVS
jgi:hypothetical protein